VRLLPPLDPKTISEGFHEATIVVERADETAGQYRISIAFSVPGARRKFDVPAKLQSGLDGTLSFKVSAKGASSIELFHFGRSVGKSGAAGTISVKASVFGPGTSMVVPVATFGSTKVFGRPVTVVVGA